MAERAPSICAYCGARDPQTVDHVPPRGIFPRPWPDDLITVPCCSACHANTSMDDTYFRDVLLSAAELAGEPNATRALETVVRSMGRPDQRRYSLSFLQSIEYEGSGQKASIPVTPRIRQVVERIARGLFWRDFHAPLPRTHEVVSACIDEKRDGLGYLAARGARPQRQPVVACGGQFSYTFLMVQDDPSSGIWIGEFFSRAHTTAIIRPRAA